MTVDVELAVLLEHGLTRDDVLTSCQLADLVGCGHRRSVVSDYARTLGPAPDPIFTVGNRKYWLTKEIIGWLEPVLHRRVERAQRAETETAERLRRAQLRKNRMWTSKSSASGYKGVTLHRASGLWRAHLYGPDGRQRSIGYHHTPEQAARAVDYVRVDDYGWPPINLPDSIDETLSAPHPDTLRQHAGPRGIQTRILQELQHEQLTCQEVFATLRGSGTTMASVKQMIYTLVAEGKVERVGYVGRRGVYRATGEAAA